jgi:hypothetical protein
VGRHTDAHRAMEVGPAIDWPRYPRRGLVEDIIGPICTTIPFSTRLRLKHTAKMHHDKVNYPSTDMSMIFGASCLTIRHT